MLDFDLQTSTVKQKLMADPKNTVMCIWEYKEKSVGHCTKSRKVVVYFQMLLEISTDVILPAALFLWSTEGVTEMGTGMFCVRKGGWG
jgi:hypothetical protein